MVYLPKVAISQRRIPKAQLRENIKETDINLIQHLLSFVLPFQNHYFNNDFACFFYKTNVLMYSQVVSLGNNIFEYKAVYPREV